MGVLFYHSLYDWTYVYCREDGCLLMGRALALLDPPRRKISDWWMAQLLNILWQMVIVILFFKILVHIMSGSVVMRISLVHILPITIRY